MQEQAKSQEITDIVFERKASVCPLFPVSIVIATLNASQAIDRTCESLLQQTDAHWEAIFVDGGSSDRTVEIIQSYNEPRFRIQSLITDNVFEMINRGCHMAQGTYVSFLFPGDLFMYPNAIALISQKIVYKGFPDLFYTASYIYDEWNNPNLIFRSLDSKLLKRGIQPTALSACWMKKSIFRKLGYFSTTYMLRGALYYLCKVNRAKECQVASDMRVFTETVDRDITYKGLWVHFKETFRCIRKFFGIWAAVQWLFTQSDTKKIIIRSWQAALHAFKER